MKKYLINPLKTYYHVYLVLLHSLERISTINIRVCNVTPNTVLNTSKYVCRYEYNLRTSS